MKSQIDWIPLSIGSIRPTQGRTLAVMQVSGGSQSFNALLRDRSEYLTDRYSERVEDAEKSRAYELAAEAMRQERVQQSELPGLQLQFAEGHCKQVGRER